MSDTKIDNQNQQEESGQNESLREFIAIPLSHIPAETLAKVKIYISQDNNYILYKNTGLGFDQDDHTRLTDSGIAFVYILDLDFAGYAGMFDDYLDNIIMDKTLELNIRIRIIYEATIALANKVVKSHITTRLLNDIYTFCRRITNLLGLEYDAIKHLIKAANHKDHNTAVHMANNCTLMLCFALYAGLSEKKTLATLGAGAMLQDIGKNFVPQELLHTAEPLNDTQKKILHNHVHLGCKQLLSIENIDEEIIDIITYHHERYDGSGYPGNVKGSKIPLIGQVAGLIDIFEAMISVRPYRPRPLTVKEAIGEIDATMTDKFDKSLLLCFSSFVRYFLLDAEYPGEDVRINFEIASMRILDKQANPSGRRHEREYFRCPAKARSLSFVQDQWVPENAQAVTIFNMSRSGIGFLSTANFQKKQLIQIIININGEIISLLGKSVRCPKQGRELNTVGIELLRVFTRSEFRAIMDKLNKNARELGYKSFD